MNKKKIGILVVGALVLGGLAYMYMKIGKGGTQSKLGGGSSNCDKVRVSQGKNKHLWLSIDQNRERVSHLKVGDKVSVDGVETTIKKIWRDKSKRSGAFQLANKVATGKTFCW